MPYKNPDEIKACKRRYYERHRQECIERAIVYNSSEQGRLLSRERRTRWRKQAMLMIGMGKLSCVNCGCDRYDLLQINHKNGGGRKEGLHGRHFYGCIINGKRKIDDLEITCTVCNILHYVQLKHGTLPFTIKWGE